MIARHGSWGRLVLGGTVTVRPLVRTAVLRALVPLVPFALIAIFLVWLIVVTASG